MPIPKGKQVSITVFVDADHAGDKVTRRSVTGIILYVNKSPIKWYSKRQNTIESSTYGAELVALRIAVEMVMEYRYKLRMMGMPVEGPDTILCDNKSAVLNTTLPSSTLKKKHNAIAYHKTREAVAANIIKILHIEGVENVADILTKPLEGTSFRKHVGKCMNRIPGPLGGVTEVPSTPSSAPSSAPSTTPTSTPTVSDHNPIGNVKDDLKPP